MACSCRNKRQTTLDEQAASDGIVKVGTESLHNPNQKAIEVSAQRSDSS